MNQKTKDFIAKLRKARKLIVRGWAQGSNARDDYGLPTSAHSSTAVRWCLNGALVRAGVQNYEITDHDGFASFYTRLLTWNDEPSRTQTEALACLDNSIAALGGKP